MFPSQILAMCARCVMFLLKLNNLKINIFLNFFYNVYENDVHAI